MAQEDDGNGGRCPLGRPGVDRTRRHDDVDLHSDKLFRELAHAFWLALRPPVLDDEVSPLNVAQFSESAPKGFDLLGKHLRAVPEKSDAVRLAGGRRRDGERGWEKHNRNCQAGEAAAFHSLPQYTGRARDMQRHAVGLSDLPTAASLRRPCGSERATAMLVQQGTVAGQRTTSESRKCLISWLPE
jgi:hypothetical protein